MADNRAKIKALCSIADPQTVSSVLNEQNNAWEQCRVIFREAGMESEFDEMRLFQKKYTLDTLKGIRDKANELLQHFKEVSHS